MWSSKVYSKRQPHLFGCEDQSSQDHMKKFHDRMKSNNFVIREVPIQKLFNVEHCTDNSSGDLSDFIKSNNFSSTSMNALDYNMPELVVFIQEDQQQYVKDICIDREVLPERKCDVNRTSDLNLEVMETISSNSFGSDSECSSQHISFKEAMKVHGFRNLMKSEMELDLGNRISIDQHFPSRTASETLREAFERERNFSRSFENWQRTSGSRVEFPHSRECLHVTDSNMYRPDISYLQSITSSDNKQVDDHQDTSNSASDSQFGQSSCTCHAKTSSIASHRSNDSISSAHSFSFPVLPVEWSGSPVRMMEADKSQSRKHRWRKMLFPCCDCDD